MSEAKQMLFARNLMTICVDGNENADYQGSLWHQYSDYPIDFSSATGLLNKMDELMDDWDFPQKGLENRSFVHGSKARYSKNDVSGGELVIDKVQEQNGTRNIQNKKGKLGTFIVQVAYRQKATWQGHVVIVEANEKKSFSSTMDFLRIMDERLGGNS